MSHRTNTVSRGIPGAGVFQGEDMRINATNTTVECQENAETASGIIFLVAGLGIGANVMIMFLIVVRKNLRRWSQGLLFHQAMVDCARAAILLPLGTSILNCQPVNKCSLVETAFLLLVTVSTVNLLTTVLNDAPVLPDEEDGDDALPMLMDSPQCVIFGMFMIWFASITINLGPTFLSGALAANSESYLNKPSCPLIQGPFRHYVLNVLWIFINVLCVLLTMYHLIKLHRDLSRSNLETIRVASMVSTMISVNAESEQETRDSRRIKSYIAKMELEGIGRVKMFMVITVAYLVFWGPLFLVTLFSYGDYKTETPSTSHEVTLHVAFVHAFVNPTLFLVLHKGLRSAAIDLICCNLRGGDVEDVDADTDANGGGLVHQNGDDEKQLDASGDVVVGVISGKRLLEDGGIATTSSVNRTYMLSEPRSESGSKKETSI